MKSLILILILLPSLVFAQSAEEVRRIMNSQSSLYDVLNINKNASTDEIRAAYRRLMKAYHPDRYLNEPQKLKAATEVMKKLNITRDTLMDPVARQKYDATIKVSPKPANTTSTTSKWTPPDFGTKEKPKTSEPPPKEAQKPEEKPKASTAEASKSSAESQKPQPSETTPRPQEKAAIKAEQAMDPRARQVSKFYEETARCGDGFYKSFIDLML
ncbi:DnaJ domain-containing protein [Bdellovibrio bacteriovorus]|uniref:DnaJ domain-containing protein n=1 Tax=Bdellovibrio TaxID=958 RepID=UPI0035A86372